MENDQNQHTPTPVASGDQSTGSVDSQPPQAQPDVVPLPSAPTTPLSPSPPVPEPQNQSTPLPQPAESQPTPPPVTVAPEEEPTEQSGLQPNEIGLYDNESSTSPQLNDYLEWEAPEFITHDKTILWYVVLLGGAAVISGLLLFFFKDIVTAAVIFVVAVILAIYSSTGSKIVKYKINDRTIHIGQRVFSYGDYKAFYLSVEGQYINATLLPLKRFGIPITLYYKNDIRDKVENMLAEFLPYQERSPDLVDRAMRNLKF